LQIAIQECERTNDVYLEARQRMRDAVRAHLASLDTPGERTALAKKMKVPVSYISNLKNGYSTPSIETARELVRITKQQD